MVGLCYPWFHMMGLCVPLVLGQWADALLHHQHLAFGVDNDAADTDLCEPIPAHQRPTYPQTHRPTATDKDRQGQARQHVGGCTRAYGCASVTSSRLRPVKVPNWQHGCAGWRHQHTERQLAADGT